MAANGGAQSGTHFRSTENNVNGKMRGDDGNEYIDPRDDGFV